MTACPEPNVVRPSAAPLEPPGVTVERRSFLSVAAGALLAPALARSPAARLAEADGATKITFEEFIAECVPKARELLADGRTSEDAYLHTVAALAVSIAGVAEPELRESSQGSGTFIGGSYGPDPFVVLYWRMEPGSVIRAHAHTYGNVVTLGLEGAARVRNYEMVGETDFEHEGPFLVRRTCDQVLTPGRINLVPLEHGYVHGFEAGREGASGIDITTRVRPRRPFPYLEVSEEALDPGGAVFEGRWTS